MGFRVWGLGSLDSRDSDDAGEACPGFWSLGRVFYGSEAEYRAARIGFAGLAFSVAGFWVPGTSV